MRRFLRTLVKGALHRGGYELRRVPTILDPVLLSQQKAFRDEKVGIIVDVGANQGETVESYRQTWPDAAIFAFEPHPQICNQLRERFRDARTVKVSCRALGAAKGSVDLKTYSSQSMHSIAGIVENASPYVPQDVRYTGSIKVPVTTLDDFAAASKVNTIDILKVDVEGYEKHVLIGGTSSLERGIIRLICIEVMFVGHFNDQWRIQEITEYLNGNGYALFDIPMIKRAGDGRARWGNAIYVSSELESSLANRQS